jgi:L-alanine-DL-glutamate epimerase-like enolase superfamily enzyme
VPTIASIEVDLIDRPAVTPAYAWRRGLRGSHGDRTTAVLRITTDDGATGMAYHEWSGPMLADIIDRVPRPELVGERADRREWLWHRLWELDRTEEFPIWLFGIVDVALWDLEGRLLGVRGYGDPSMWNTSSMGAHHSPSAAVATGCCNGSVSFHQRWLSGSAAITAISRS